MQNLLQDVRFGARMLIKRPGFTLVAVVTLALGIGATTTIFSVVDAVLLRPLPYPQPERLMRVYGTYPERGVRDAGISAPDVREWRRRNQSFEKMAAYNAHSYNISGSNEPERVIGAIVSADFLPLFGITPLQGRVFSQEEETYGKHRVVVVSERLWARRFGAQTKLADQTIKLNSESFTVIGIMPAGFRFPDDNVELWTPLAAPAGSDLDTRGSGWLRVVAQLKPGVTEAQAQADMDGLNRRLSQEIKGTGLGARVQSLNNSTVGDVRRPLIMLLVAVACVLMIACVNIANLLLARATSRRREITIRAALGAGRWHLIRQLLAESLVLGLLGGISGLILAVWGVDLLVKFGPDLPRLNEIGIDSRVLIFALALSVLTSLIFGIAPAIQSSRTNLNESLKDGNKGAGSGAGSHRLLNSLVIAEVAIAVVLLVCAGLMINSLVRLQRVDPGLRVENVLTMQIALPEVRYPDEPPDQIINFYQRLIERVGALPGVQSAGVTNRLPFTGTDSAKPFTREDRPAPKSIELIPFVRCRQVTAGYFDTLGIRLTRGRYLTERDTHDTLPVAVVNETMVKSFWPDEDPIGKRFLLGMPEELMPAGIAPPGFRFIRWTVAGVVADVKQDGLNREGPPEVYILSAQNLTNDTPERNIYLAVRSSGDPAALTAAIRRQVLELDGEQPISEVKTMENLIADSLSRSRFNTLLLTIFALVALILAAVGVYGVISYSVSKRTQEIGLRIALGAQRGDVLGLIVRRGMLPALIGTGIGVAGALGLTRLISSALFVVGARDPLTFALIVILLIIVELFACYIPARRAARVDPMIALRYE